MPMTIVGVVADSKYQAIREETTPQLLLPAFETRGLNNLTVYVRSRLRESDVLVPPRSPAAWSAKRVCWSSPGWRSPHPSLGG